MSEEAGFLGAILAEPGEDLHRQVYADWLDDHGQESRAEFIRAQCALAAMPPEQKVVFTCGGYYCDVDKNGHQLHRGCRFDRLRRREQELLDGHWAEWAHAAFDPLAHDVGVATGGSGTRFKVSLYDRSAGEAGHLECDFRRGFVASVTLPCAAWVGRRCEACLEPNEDVPHPKCRLCRGAGLVGGHGPALVRAAPLEEVWLYDKWPLSPREGAFLWAVEDGEDVPPWRLPAALADRLAPRYASLTYPDRGLAEAALSAACLAWARSRP